MGHIIVYHGAEKLHRPEKVESPSEYQNCKPTIAPVMGQITVHWDGSKSSPPVAPQGLRMGSPCPNCGEKLALRWAPRYKEREWLFCASCKEIFGKPS